MINQNNITPQNNLENEFSQDSVKLHISRFGKARSSKELDNILTSDGLLSNTEDRLPILKSQFDLHPKFQHDRSQSL